MSLLTLSNLNKNCLIGSVENNSWNGFWLKELQLWRFNGFINMETFMNSFWINWPRTEMTMNRTLKCWFQLELPSLTEMVKKLSITTCLKVPTFIMSETICSFWTRKKAELRFNSKVKLLFQVLIEDSLRPSSLNTKLPMKLHSLPNTKLIKWPDSMPSNTCTRAPLLKPIMEGTLTIWFKN